MIGRTIVDAIFDTDIDVVVATVPEIRAWLAKQSTFEDRDSDEEWASANAETLQSAALPARWLVWFPPVRDAVTDPQQLATLVHESLHVTAQVLSDRGVVLCPESEEVFAYYQTAVFVQMFAVLQASARSHRSPTTTTKKKPTKQRRRRAT